MTGTERNHAVVWHISCVIPKMDRFHTSRNIQSLQCPNTAAAFLAHLQNQVPTSSVRMSQIKLPAILMSSATGECSVGP